MRILVTGGCGFIGSAAVRFLVDAGHQVLNVDKLTYAGDLRTVASVSDRSNYQFEKLDILNEQAIEKTISDFAPERIWHLAAESHVDRSIDSPESFIDTNIRGSFVMLQAARAFWSKLQSNERERFRFIQVSTDEVYGSLGTNGLFTDDTPYKPNSPYSASKASANHLARAWNATFGLPTIISNCSNNYGPFQNREKLIPTIIRKAFSGQPIPIYGKGNNVRDWLYVDDHISALLYISEKGISGSSYNIGGSNEIANIALAQLVCELLDERKPRKDGSHYSDLIQFVIDRPGHDYRYAIDPTKAKCELGWQPREDLRSGLIKTIDWYVDRPDWYMGISDVNDRLGLSPSKSVGENNL